MKKNKEYSTLQNVFYYFLIVSIFLGLFGSFIGAMFSIGNFMGK